MIRGKLYIISAPSGTGKSCLIQELLKNNLPNNTQISISHTTRSPRSDEINGKHYFFIRNNEFKKMIYQNEFLEYAKIFGNFYGTSKKVIESSLASGIDIFLDINWQGTKQIRDKISQTCSIFILPPSKNELYRRLKERNRDNEKVIAERMEQAVIEMEYYNKYDYLIINDDFNRALINLKNIIYAENLRTYYQKHRYSKTINKLLTL